MIMKLQRWIEDLEDKEWGYVRTRTPLMAKVTSIRFPDTGITTWMECSF